MRIVSLAPSNTETLFFLGLGREIVGVTEQCDYPEGVRDKERIGSFAYPDVNRITSLKPDLVVAAGKIHERFMNEFKRQDISVFVFASRSVEEILTGMEELGRICGRGELAQSLVDSLRRRIDGVREGIPEDTARLRLFRLMSSHPLITPGPGSYQYDAIRISGGRPIPLNIEEAYTVIPLEAVIEFDPEVIVSCGHRKSEVPKSRCKGCDHPNPVCQREIEDIYGWKGWEGIRAVRECRIYNFPCRLICRPGPKVVDLIEELARVLYPCGEGNRQVGRRWSTS